MTTLVNLSALTTTELQAIVDRSFVEAGLALRVIRDERRYRETHGTFEEFCRTHWGMSRTHANRSIEAASVIEALAPIGAKPTNEAQARELAKVEPERRQEVWARVVEEAPAVNGKPKVTARLVSEVASEAKHKEDTSDTGPLSEHKQWIYRLQKLYRQAPTEARVGFRKWLAMN